MGSPVPASLAEQLKAIVDALPDASVVADRLGVIVMANAQAEALFGFLAGELVGATVEKLIPERYRGRHPAHRNSYFQDPRTRPMGAGHLELFGVRKDGTEFPAEISLSPLETEDGVFAMTAIRDISARKKVESKFRGLLEAAPDAMVIADARGRIVLVNAQAERQFGYERKELLGQLVEALIPPRFRRAHRGHRSGYFSELRTRPMGAGVELFGLRRDGSEFPAEISLSPLETEDGVLAITAIRDITDRKHAEEERARLHARLEQLLSDQKRFFTNVSHELRTPLTLVLGSTHKLLSGARREEQRADLEVIARNARTLLRHVNDLLDVARLEAGGQSAQPALEDIARIVRIAAAHFELLATERHIAFLVDVPESLTRAVDGSKFQRVLLNLLSNAFKFTPAGGTIRCQARAATEDEARGGFVLEVADSGPGIPESEREAVFQRFRQLGHAAESGGTGLGLAIAKEFVDLHGGRISVEHAREGGALFYVVIPALTEARGAPETEYGESSRDAAQALREEPHPESSLREGAPLVLVVEDHPEMSRYIRDVLAPQASVELARNGREGLERALMHTPDLILTDLMMSGGSGEELVAAIRAHRELDNVPVVVLTAKSDPAERVGLLRAGVQDFMLKPFDGEELHARVAGLLEAKRARDLLHRELDTRGQDLVALARDLAERKRQLEGALEATRLARDEAESSSRVKSEFLSLVSHELKTPLASLHLQIDLLGRDPHAGDRQRTATPRLRAAVGRLSALIDSLLEQTQIASGGLKLRWQKVDLRVLVTEAVEETRPLAEAKGLSLVLEAARDLPVTWSDPSLLQIVVANLVGNAVKFTEQGSVHISLAAGSEGQRIAVADSGPGIAAEQQRRIFEPFEQLAPVSHKHAPGVGLGLALVRELCAVLGLGVELTSQVGVGSTFSVVVPAGDALHPGPGLAANFAGRSWLLGLQQPS